MSSNNKWLPFYVADYLGDTGHLTTLEHGAYLLLLMHYWRNGPLPDDDGKLARIAKMDGKTWREVGPVVREFFTNGDGALHQKRMDWELRRWGEIADKRREAGKRGAEAKHRPHPTVEKAAEMPQRDRGKRLANAMANAQQLPVDNLANATILPDRLPPQNVASAMRLPEVCQDFASVQPHPQREVLSYLGEEMRAGARREPIREQNLPPLLPPDGLKELLGESLRVAEAAANAPKPQRAHTPDVQIAAVKKSRPMACYLPPERLAEERKRLGVIAA